MRDKFINNMTTDEILAEIADREAWLESVKGEELGGGSPLEYFYERLDDLTREYEIRLDFYAQPE